MDIKYNVKSTFKTNDEIDKELIFNEKLLKVIIYLENLRIEDLSSD